MFSVFLQKQQANWPIFVCIDFVSLRKHRGVWHEVKIYWITTATSKQSHSFSIFSKIQTNWTSHNRFENSYFYCSKSFIFFANFNCDSIQTERKLWTMKHLWPIHRMIFTPRVYAPLRKYVIPSAFVFVVKPMSVRSKLA